MAGTQQDASPTDQARYAQDVDWADYFLGLSAFAGVVFAITLAARHLPSHKLVYESLDRNTLRLWDSISVTYELAAGGLLALLYLVRESWVSGLFGTLVGLVGWRLYLNYIRLFWRQWHRKPGTPKAEQLSTVEALFFLISIIPLTALTAAPVMLWMQVPDNLVDWFAAASTWLVFSGTTQAVWWYVTSWETPAN